MTDIDPNSDDSSFQWPTFRLQTLVYFSFILITSLYSNTIRAQQYDRTQTRIFYKEVIRQTECGGFGDGLSEDEFYLMLTMYFGNKEKVGYRSSSTTSKSNYNNYYYSKQTASKDTVVRVVYIHDTIQQPAARDTVFISANLPSSDDVVMTQEILKKIIKDKEFADIIRATVAEMPAEELEKFQQELNQEFRGIKENLAREKAKRTIAELEAKKEKELAHQEKHKEQKEKWKALSKEERKELIKARAAILAYETADAAGAVAAVAGGIVMGAGALLSSGILAIGKGIMRSPLAIWNWMENHFYIKIDLSCEMQAQIRAYRRVHNYKPDKVKKYSGFCPRW